MNHRAFTLIELLVVIALIALLIGLLAPALATAQRSARTAKCRMQLKHLGAAWVIYADQHPDALPAAVNLPHPKAGAPEDELTIMQALKPYIADLGVYECPSDDRDYFAQRGTSYEYLPGVAIALDPANIHIIAEIAQHRPQIVPILSDAARFHPAPSDITNPQLTVYYDAHVDWLWEEVPKETIE